ncbi:MAG: hypothetical protein HUJ69_07765, partial [Lachnospiraceae bacterium]|nr:hypothetical protein [Lachnospiraceae bacterium]
CKATPITLNAGSHYALVIIYADPEGNATVTEVQDLNEDSGMGLMGGREFAELEDNAEAQIAFEKATCGLLGTNYETIALISTQVVAGTNYTFVARTTPVTPNAQASFKLVTVYDDLEGNAQIIDVEEMGM